MDSTASALLPEVIRELASWTVSAGYLHEGYGILGIHVHSGSFSRICQLWQCVCLLVQQRTPSKLSKKLCTRSLNRVSSTLQWYHSVGISDALSRNGLAQLYSSNCLLGGLVCRDWQRSLLECLLITANLNTIGLRRDLETLLPQVSSD